MSKKLDERPPGGENVFRQRAAARRFWFECVGRGHSPDRLLRHLENTARHPDQTPAVRRALLREIRELHGGGTS